MWERLARVMEAYDDVHVGKVDSIAEKGLAKRFTIQSFPTLKLISGTKVYCHLSYALIPAGVPV